MEMFSKYSFYIQKGEHKGLHRVVKMVAQRQLAAAPVQERVVQRAAAQLCAQIVLGLLLRPLWHEERSRIPEPPARDGEGAMRGAAINVRVNTRLMKDSEYAAGLDAETDAMIAEYSARADEVFRAFFYR